MPLPLEDISTPAYVMDQAAIGRNLAVAQRIKQESGASILLATKAFACTALLPIFAEVLDGSTASGLYEAQLGHDHMGKEVHVYAPAYTEAEITALVPLADHVYFNSVSQLKRFSGMLPNHIGRGLRVNPALSQVTNASIYDPSSPDSRFGVHMEELTPELLAQIHVLHVHNLCENMAEDSVALIEHLRTHIPHALHAVHTLNLGGGHYITHPNYDVDRLITAIKQLMQDFDVQVILEPGGALAYETGYLVASVLDIIERPHKNLVILDSSATCHMPDVLEMPYRPTVIGDKKDAPYPYQLTGKTCLTGDIIGDYAFDAPLKAGDKLIFTDMAQYTMVKTTSFNGMPLPDIGVVDEEGNYRQIRQFGYDDFLRRLG